MIVAHTGPAHVHVESANSAGDGLVIYLGSAVILIIAAAIIYALVKSKQTSK